MASTEVVVVSARIIKLTSIVNWPIVSTIIQFHEKIAYFFFIFCPTILITKMYVVNFYASGFNLWSESGNLITLVLSGREGITLPNTKGTNTTYLTI